MNNFKRLVPLVFALLLVACQSVPNHDTTTKSFASAAGKDTGMIRITSFHIPKDEPGVTFLLTLGVLGGANMSQPVFTSLFDITNAKARYIGTLAVYDESWLETEVPAGRHTLMLTLAPKWQGIFVEGLPSHADFIDVEIPAGGFTHVVLSRYGFTRAPYLGEIAIDKARHEKCLAIAGTYRERLRKVEEYMAADNLSKDARDFKNFCFKLSGPKLIRTPNQTAIQQFAEASERIEAFRAEQYPKWKAEGEKRPPYDLMRSDEPVQTLQP